MNSYATTEHTDATETREALAAAAMLAGERWARRPNGRLMFHLMRQAHQDEDAYWRKEADRTLARLADAAEAASR